MIGGGGGGGEGIVGGGMSSLTGDGTGASGDAESAGLSPEHREEGYFT